MIRPALSVEVLEQAWEVADDARCAGLRQLLFGPLQAAQELAPKAGPERRGPVASVATDSNSPRRAS